MRGVVETKQILKFLPRGFSVNLTGKLFVDLDIDATFFLPASNVRR
jgi:hypothetical protein